MLWHVWRQRRLYRRLAEIELPQYVQAELLPTVDFDQTSSGQVALIIYEWNDVQYLGAQTGDETVSGAIVLHMVHLWILTTVA